MAARRGVKLALDTSGPALKASLGHGIDLLNPSLSEFETIVGRESSEPSTRAMQTVDLVRSGIARMIALTLGSERALGASKRP
jgi:6-phosphofructokinase 2